MDQKARDEGKNDSVYHVVAGKSFASELAKQSMWQELQQTVQERPFSVESPSTACSGGFTFMNKAQTHLGSDHLCRTLVPRCCLTMSSNAIAESLAGCIFALQVQSAMEPDSTCT